MRDPSQRQRRVQELLVHEISDIVRREVKDPRVSLVTVTGAEVSPDLRSARVFVSRLGGAAEQTAEALKGLRSAAGFIRGEFARRSRLRFTPTLEFRADPAIERGARIHALLASVSDDQNDEPELLSQAASEIKKANSLLIACHVRPDCDALGSLLALGLACEGMGKHVAMVSADGVPAAYRFLPHAHRIAADAQESPDLAIGVDADGSARLGGAETAVLGAPAVIDIDHHTGTAPYGDLVLVDPGAAATGEIILRLLDTLGAPLTREIAVCLMAAILTDTGSFRFSNVTADTFRSAARLIEAGAEPGPIYQAVYEQKSASATRLAGLALEGLRTERGGAMVWSKLSQAEFATAGASDEDTDGIVGQLQAVRGARVAILLREQPEGDVRASLRSRDGIDVAAICRRFGGGGHRAAAGCTLAGPLDEAARRLVQAALVTLDEES